MNGPVIGVVGTAKNTGKTTTLNAVASHMRRKGRSIVLTSIGYDGEDLDTITGLPKPRVNVEPQDTVVTALPLLRSSTAGFGRVFPTGFQCALGPVCMAETTTPGKVVLAGPTSTKDVGAVLSHVDREAGQVALLDGALSRMSPMILATHMLVATGAARYQYPGFVTQGMEDLWSAFSLPLEEKSCPDLTWFHGLSESGSAGSLLEAVCEIPRRGDQLSLWVDGVVNPAVLDWLLARLQHVGIRGISLVFQHPIYLLLSGDPAMWRSIVLGGPRGGYRVSVRSSSRLLGFTINPYVPLYDESRREYVASYVSPRSFLDEIRRLTSLPCTDIVLEGASILESWVDGSIDGRAEVSHTNRVSDSYGGLV